jgi:hypothetical protein
MNNPFNWQDAQRYFASRVRAEPASERGLKVSTFDRIASWRGIGMVHAYCQAKRRSAWCISFPIEDETGAVVRAHCRWPEKNAQGKWDWFYCPYDPEQKPISALVYGKVSTARQVFSLESQWDDFALIEILDLFDEIETGEVATVCTRGANFANRLSTLPWRSDVAFYAVPQTDEAGRAWLKHQERLSVKVHVVWIPEPYKDLNQWVKEGKAKAADLEPLLEGAQLLEAPQNQAPEELGREPTFFEELQKDFAPQPKDSDLEQNEREDRERAQQNGPTQEQASEQIVSVIEGGESIERIRREHFYDFDQILFRMKSEAFYGLAGEITHIIAEQCEACPEIILGQLLVMIGNQIGRTAYTFTGRRLFANEYVVSVGETARSRRGTSLDAIENLFETVDSSWLRACRKGGIQSGEGIVFELRDEKWGIDKHSKSKVDRQAETLLDPGVSDKRLLIIAEEFSALLKMAARQGNSTTEILRELWDSPRSQRNTNKNSPLCATEPHVSLIGHCTKMELKEVLQKVDLSNGFANRILWLAAYRAKNLHSPQEIDWQAFPQIVKALQAIMETFYNPEPKKQNLRQVTKDPQAHDFWQSIYVALCSKPRRGFTDAALARDAAHVMKLALIYCLLDHSTLITKEHLVAAMAFYDYAEASTGWLFGELTGNKLANRMLYVLRTYPEAKENGLSLTELHEQVANRNLPAAFLREALDLLVQAHLVNPVIVRYLDHKEIIHWKARLRTP